VRILLEAILIILIVSVIGYQVIALRGLTKKQTNQLLISLDMEPVDRQEKVVAVPNQHLVISKSVVRIKE
jgi:hypothetical protein